MIEDGKDLRRRPAHPICIISQRARGPIIQDMLRRFYRHGPKMERARVQRPEGQGIKRPRSGTSQLDLVIESF